MPGQYTDAIQEALGSLKEPEKLKTKYGIARVIKAKDDGSSKFRMTSLSVDRDGEVVMPEGVQMDNWIANPVVLWAHGWGETGSMPIAKGLTDTIKRAKKYIDVNVMFDEADEFAMKVGKKVENGFLSTGSIGFIPIVIGKEPILTAQTGVTFLESELLEFSVVPIPSNPEATVRRSAVRREYGEFAADCARMGHAIDDQVLRLVDTWLYDQEICRSKNIGKQDIENANEEIMQELIGLQSAMLSIKARKIKR